MLANNSSFGFCLIFYDIRICWLNLLFKVTIHPIKELGQDVLHLRLPSFIFSWPECLINQRCTLMYSVWYVFFLIKCWVLFCGSRKCAYHPMEGIGFPRGKGGGRSISLISQWEGGCTVGKYFQRDLVTRKRVTTTKNYHDNLFAKVLNTTRVKDKVVKSSRLPAKVTTYFVSICWPLCLASLRMAFF